MNRLFLIFVLAAMAMAISAAAPVRLAFQSDGQENGALPGFQPRQTSQKSDLLQLAAELGRASGDAEYCEYDPRVVERFIVNAQARLARETTDSLRMAGARLEFNAFAAYGRSRGPDDGCTEFEAQFADLRRFVQR